MTQDNETVSSTESLVSFFCSNTAMLAYFSNIQRGITLNPGFKTNLFTSLLGEWNMALSKFHPISELYPV